MVKSGLANSVITMARQSRIERWADNAGEWIQSVRTEQAEHKADAAATAQLNAQRSQKNSAEFHSASEVVVVNRALVVSPSLVLVVGNEPSSINVSVNTDRPIPPEGASTAVEQDILRGLHVLEEGDAASARVHFEQAVGRQSAGTVLPSLLAAATALAAPDRDAALEHLLHVVDSSIRISRREDWEQTIPAEPDLAVLRLSVSGGIYFPLQTEASLLVPLSSLGAALLIVHLLPVFDRADQATTLLEDLVDAADNPRLSILLAATYADAGRWSDVLKLLGETEVVDKWSLYPGLLKARALEQQDLPDAALSAYGDLFRVANSAELRRTTVAKEARYRRGLLNRASGRRAAARKDFASVVRDDPGYRDVVELSQEGASKGTPGGREPIPQEVKDRVWRRDEGRCTNCGMQEKLEFDHIIPLAMGGANTERNLQLLCESCNRGKGANL